MPRNNYCWMSYNYLIMMRWLHMRPIWIERFFISFMNLLVNQTHLLCWRWPKVYYYLVSTNMFQQNWFAITVNLTGTQILQSFQINFGKLGKISKGDLVYEIGKYLRQLKMNLQEHLTKPKRIILKNRLRNWTILPVIHFELISKRHFTRAKSLTSLVL